MEGAYCRGRLMIGCILLLTGRWAYKWGAGRLICGSLQYGVFAGRANVFACKSAMLKLKREVEMGRVKTAGGGGGGGGGESFVCQCTEFSKR